MGGHLKLVFSPTILQILYHMREEGPLGQPEHCPKWVYNVLHQCWTYESEQRPPFLAIFDCLTSRYLPTVIVNNKIINLILSQNQGCRFEEAEVGIPEVMFDFFGVIATKFSF